jgi:hypothetical protein
MRCRGHGQPCRYGLAWIIHADPLFHDRLDCGSSCAGKAGVGVAGWPRVLGWAPSSTARPGAAGGWDGWGVMVSGVQGLQGVPGAGQVGGGGVAAVVDRGQVAGAAGLELLHSVFDVGLGSVAGVEELDLPAGGVGENAPYSQSGCSPNFGRFDHRVWGAPHDQAHACWPAGQPVPARAVAHDAGQVGHLDGPVGFAVGVHRGAPVALA